jgi:hypothetical protein
METIIYTNPDNAQKDCLLKEVSQVIPVPIMVFDFKNLFGILKSKLSGQVLVAFNISDAQELEHLRSNKHYLFNTRYIIILPSREESLISKALSLYPRYLAHTDYRLKDVAAVLKKMNQNYDQNKRV